MEDAVAKCRKYDLGLAFRVVTAGRVLWQSKYCLPPDEQTNTGDEGLTSMMAEGFDPFKEAVTACKRHDVPVYAWFDLFDRVAIRD